MSEPSDEKRKPAKARFNPWVLGVLLLIVGASVAGALWWRQATSDGSLPTKGTVEAAQGPLKAHATGALSSLITHEAPRPLEDIGFLDGEGKSVRLSDFKGRVVVLNLWATWCTPCRVELPTLAGLQKAYDPQEVLVLPLSIDKANDTEKARAELGLNPPLPLYIDSEVQALSKWGVTGMPTTIVLDARGLEVARLEGEADWNAPEVRALLDAVRE